MIIAHPPCTYLSNVATRAFSLKATPAEQVVKRWEERAKAAIFFMCFALADCERICVENPVGFMNNNYRKPDQIIHPYMFADSKEDTEQYVTKATCLWLKGLPQLQTNGLPKPNNAEIWGRYSNGKAKCWEDHYTRSGKVRSKTFTGIAQAMAEQWGDIKRGEAMSQLIDKGELLNRIAVECNYDTEHPLESYTKLISIINSFPAKTSPFDEGHPVLQGDQYSWF